MNYIENVRISKNWRRSIKQLWAQRRLMNSRWERSSFKIDKYGKRRRKVTERRFPNWNLKQTKEGTDLNDCKKTFKMWSKNWNLPIGNLTSRKRRTPNWRTTSVTLNWLLNSNKWIKSKNWYFQSTWVLLIRNRSE